MEQAEKISALIRLVGNIIPERKWFGRLVLTFHEGQLRTVEEESKAMSAKDISKLFDMKDIVEQIK